MGGCPFFWGRWMLQWEPFAGGHIGPGGRSVRQRRAGRDGARPYRRGERADGGEVRYRECTAAGRCGHRPLRETRVAAGCGHPALRWQGGGVRRNGTPGSSCRTGARRVVCRSGTPGRRALRVQGRGCVVMARRTIGNGPVRGSFPPFFALCGKLLPGKGRIAS